MCYNGIRRKSWLTFAWFTCILCMLSFSLWYEYYKEELIMLLWVPQESGQEAQSPFPPKQAEPFICRVEDPVALLGSEEHTAALASPCTASCVQQPSAWFQRCSTLSSHTRGAAPLWGETNSKCERNIVKCYCCLVIFLSKKKLCFFHVLIV